VSNVAKFTAVGLTYSLTLFLPGPPYLYLLSLPAASIFFFRTSGSRHEHRARCHRGKSSAVAARPPGDGPPSPPRAPVCFHRRPSSLPPAPQFASPVHLLLGFRWRMAAHGSGPLDEGCGCGVPQRLPSLPARKRASGGNSPASTTLAR
jgi:hypothetical protein